MSLKWCQWLQYLSFSWCQRLQNLSFIWCQWLQNLSFSWHQRLQNLSFKWHQRLHNFQQISRPCTTKTVNLTKEWRKQYCTFCFYLQYVFFHYFVRLTVLSGKRPESLSKIMEPFMPTERQVLEPLMPTKRQVLEPLMPTERQVLEPLMPTERQVLEPFMPFQWHWSWDSELFLVIWRGYSDLRKKMKICFRISTKQAITYQK